MNAPPQMSRPESCSHQLLIDGRTRTLYVHPHTARKENAMPNKTISFLGIALFAHMLLLGAAASAHAQQAAPAVKSAYPSMAPLDQYLMNDEKAEIALARTAAPASISGAAQVMVLRRDGYATVVKGGNGFLCIVERAWASSSDSPDFWNPKLRAPNCFNAPATKTYVPVYFMKTKLALAGKSKMEIVQAAQSALDKKELPAMDPASMAYMMSKQQYLGDGPKSWHSHLMFFLPGDVSKSWGADLPDSPVMAQNNPEERMTILFVVADKWSDGTPAPAMK
jgi:hypothetical protein